MTLEASSGAGTHLAPTHEPLVSVLYTSANTVVEDFKRVMELAHFEQHLPKTSETLLKVNISWQHYYPGCSTSPWQLDGVTQALRGAGYDRITPVQNGTVVVDSHDGERGNKHDRVFTKHAMKSVHLQDKGARWVPYAPKGKMLVLDKVFPDGIEVPEMFFGTNIVHMPTLKTHVFTTMTGAMKNAFGGLLNNRRHWTHSVIHETLVDLLRIQQEIHTGIFAVMDGTIAGDGPGPRAMRPHVKNVILASSDSVAMDAVAAKMMGFDPMSLPFVRLAHEAGLGVGNPSEITVEGLDISNVNYNFSKDEDTFVSWGQKQIYWGKLHKFEKALLRTPIVPWSFFASNVYHNYYWYPLLGKRRIAKMMDTEWGKLFKSY
ncbi:MAG: iron-sulfur cluster-binding protein [Anaerolinea sp.]|nr:iron-sulfur cluster-binding protein [Anaerolinea sp.]